MSQITVFFLGIALLFHTTCASAGGSKPKFNYSDPTQWGRLSSEYEECSTGKRQSPISIISTQTSPNRKLGPLASYYRVQNASLLCNGLVVEVAIEGKSELIIDGKNYIMLQMHWHTPSEHRINGFQFPAELHQVHKSEDGSLAVIGILYRYGKPDPIVSWIRPHLEELSKKKHRGDHDEENVIPIEKFPSMLIKDRASKYYRYSGSLSTPPCTEQVTWSIISMVKTMSKEQVEALRAPLDAVNKKNSRPVQPLNGRKIQQYT